MESISEVIYGVPKKSLSGEVTIPPSKSVAHRAILSAALTVLKSDMNKIIAISNIDMNNDMKATLNAVHSIGIKSSYNVEQKMLTISSELGVPLSNEIDSPVVVDCGESGSTLRFVIPIFAALGISATFIGSGRLPERPLDVYDELLPNHGVSISRDSDKNLPMTINGKLKSGDYKLRGDVSSQFITGLLFALPLLDDDSKIELTTKLESKGYVDLTIGVLNDFEIAINEVTSNEYFIRGNQHFGGNSLIENYMVEGDYSHTAFLLNFAALSNTGEEIRIKGLREKSLQGDKACIDIYRDFGLNIRFEKDTLIAKNDNYNKDYAGLSAIKLDARQIPDLVPPIAVCAAFAKGTTKIYGAERLRIKESDRLVSMANAINAIGGKAEITNDGLIIEGIKEAHKGKIYGENDHRVVMSIAAAVLRCNGDITATDAESINKSYPNFFRDYNNLGGEANVVNMG